MTSKFVSRSGPEFLLAALLLVFASACPRRHQPPPGATGPLIERLEQQAEHVRAVRADARIAMEAPPGTPGAAGSRKFKALLTAADNSRLRMEIFSPLGIPAFILAMDGEHVTALSPLSGEYMEVPIDDLAVQGSAGGGPIPLPLARVADFARGVVPLMDGARSEEESDTGAPVLVIRDDGGRELQRIVFDAEGGWPGHVSYSDDGQDGSRSVALNVRLADYRAAGNGETQAVLPHSLRVEKRGGVHAEMKLSGVEINPDLAAGLFHLEAPPGRKSPQE